MFVVATAVERDPKGLKQRAPAVWRRVRRFNAPVQLAIAAAAQVLARTADPADVTLISLAPCQSGSPDAFAWVDRVNARQHEDDVPLRINPVHTLHAVDNLALSALSILLGSEVEGVGLGGAAGQAWAALDIAREKLAAEPDRDVVILAGDQDCARTSTAPVAVALLVSSRAPSTTRAISIDAVERSARPCAPTPHAARGLVALAGALDAAEPGSLRHEVDPADSDGFDRVIVLATVRGAGS